MLFLLLAVVACAPDPEAERVKTTTKATYDRDTGRLTELTYDQNKDGVIDTWTQMEGAKILSSRIDTDQNGKIDRWEYYGGGAQLAKVAMSRANDGVADTWLYPGPDGRASRAELSSRRNGKVDRWESYEAGVLIRAEEDTNDDGRADKWETYADGRVVTVSFDENNDGKPDRRLTYAPDGSLASVESQPDSAGTFRKKVDVGR